MAVASSYLRLGELWNFNYLGVAVNHCRNHVFHHGHHNSWYFAGDIERGLHLQSC